MIFKNSIKFSFTKFMKELKVEEDKIIIIARRREEEISREKTEKKKHYMGRKWDGIGKWTRTK